MMMKYTSSILALSASSVFLIPIDAFLAPTSPLGSNGLRVMPDEPFGSWEPDSFGSDGSASRPSMRNDPWASASRAQTQQDRQAQGRPFDPDGRAYYPDRNPQPPMPQQPPRTVGPDNWEAGRIQQGYGEVRPEILQGGGSRRTWQTGGADQTVVSIGSEGRPIYANAEVWEGPGNTPARMRMYSEDGGRRPWNAVFQNTNRGSGSSVMDLRNTGPLEFPQDVSVRGGYDGSKGMTKQEKDYQKDQQGYQPSPEKVTKEVQGQSLSYFNVKAGVSAVMVELSSEGRPMFAEVELWQGPGDIKQCAEIYSDNGSDRVWSAVIETQGRECTVAVRNVGPGLVYPFTASVDPIF